MRPWLSRARSPVTSESSMALRNARASAKSDSTRWRLRMSRANITSTVTKAMAIAVTKAVNTFGKTSGAARQLSMRKTMACPGKSSNCWAVKTRLPRRGVPNLASRVPSDSVKDTSWLRVSCGPTMPARISLRA